MTDIFASILEFICIYITAKSFFQLPLLPKFIDIISCIMIIMPSLIIPSPYAVITWILGQVLYLFYITLLNKGSLSNKIIVYCLSYATVLLTQFIIISILSFANISFHEAIMPIIGNVMTIILISFLFLKFQFHRMFKFISKAAMPYKLLFINCYFTLTAVLLYFKLDKSKFYGNVIYLVLILLLIIFTNACVLYYDQKLYFEHQKLLSYQKNLPIYQSLIDEIRATQHEFSNRIQAFENLPLIYDDYDSLCNALQKNAACYSITNRAYPLLQMNMPILAASLYNLYCFALKEKIDIIFDISSIQLESHAPEYQLADFVCILTQNAIEACKAGDQIYVRLSSHNGLLHYEIRNPIERLFSINETTQFFQKNFSTKKKQIKSDGIKHGLGLFHLSTSIINYNGTVGVDCAAYDNRNWITFTLDV